MGMLWHGNAHAGAGCGGVVGWWGFFRRHECEARGRHDGRALRVILLSHAVSLAILLVAVWWRGDAFPHGTALAWGLGAGVTAGIALACFYVALSRGAMGASAALSGLLAAAIPAAVSASAEGSPGLMRLVGFLVAGAAIWLIAAGPNPEAKTADRGTVWLAVVAGVGFGIYFVALKFANSAGVIWPLATCRMGSLSVCSLLVGAMALKGTAGEAPVRLTRRAVVWALGAVLLDTSGNLLFVAATRAGRLDVAAVLASLYPASTILLAAWMLRERPTRRQGLGMAVAVAAVVMITI